MEINKTDYEALDLRRIRESEDVMEAIRKIPTDYRTENVGYEAVKRDPACIRYIPAECMSERMVKEIAGHRDFLYPDSLKYISKELWTEALGIEAVKLNPLSLRYIPEEVRTKKMCEVAFEKAPSDKQGFIDLVKAIPYPDVLLDVLKSCRTPERDVFELFPEIKEAYLTNDVVEEALKTDRRIFTLLPDVYKTKERCQRAVADSFLYLSQVPEPMKTPGLCKKAWEESRVALRYFPDELLTPEFLKEQVKKNSLMLHEIPEKFRSKDLCRLALQDPHTGTISAIPYPDVLIEYLEAAEKGQKFPAGIPEIKYLNPDLLTHEVVKKLIELRPLLYKDLPPAFKENKELAEHAVRTNCFILQYIEDRFKTPELCLDAFRNAGMIDLSPHIPASLKREDYYKQLILETGNGGLLCSLPKASLSREICKLAIKHTASLDEGYRLRVIAHTPYPDMWLEGFKGIQHKNNAQYLLSLIPAGNQTPELIRAAIKIKPEAIYAASQEVMNQKLYSLAVRYGLFHLSDIPEPFRNIECCLRLEKVSPYNYEYVPELIRTRSNMYTFNKELESATGKTYPYEHIREIYEGKPFVAKRIMTTKGTFCNLTVKWDNKSGQFLQCIKQSQQQTPKNRPKLS